MRILSLPLVLGLTTLVSSRTIILTNDDGWGASNIRATYKALKEAGHNVFMSAPLNDQSGTGGTFILPKTLTSDQDSDWGLVKAGQPLYGYDTDDNHIWHFPGTPPSAACFGLDYVLPNFFSNITVDLVIAGPNFGTNLGPFVFTLSGTVGATYFAVGRGIPAIAFSGTNKRSSYLTLTDDELNPSNIYAKKVTEIVNALFEKAGDNPRVLPLSVGLNVNLPDVGTDSKIGCTNPSFKYTRITGSSAITDKLVYNATTGLFKYGDYISAATQSCINGDCTLPDETSILNTRDSCVGSISAFSIDYDTPTELTKTVENLLSGVL